MNVKPNRRYKREQRKKKKRRRLLFGIILVIVLFITLGTNLFKINQIEVKGNNKLEAADIISVSGIKVGDNIFDIRNKRVEDDLYKLPYVKAVEVKKKYPKGINIIVEERKEVMQIKLKKSFFYVDDEGIVLAEEKSRNEHLLAVTNFKLKDKDLKINTGDNIYELIKLDGVKRFVGKATELEIINEIRELNLAQKNDVKIDMHNGIIVDFGALDDVEYKLKLLNEILIDIETKDIACERIIMDKGKYPIIKVNN